MTFSQSQPEAHFLRKSSYILPHRASYGIFQHILPADRQKYRYLYCNQDR